MGFLRGEVMKRGIELVLLMGAVGAGVLAPKPLLAQACQDEEAMVADYKKSIADLAATVKKESLEDFTKAYHRKNCLTKLTLAVGIVSGAADCFEKAAQDPATPKDQMETDKSKHDSYLKLKEKVSHYRDALKPVEDAKDAKTLIEKINLAE
jgi:hypothetical protein